MRLFIVRHGETAWNRESRFQGQRDIELNETGLAQAGQAAERFRGYPFDAVVVSPLARAAVTGRKIYEASKCGSFIVDEGFSEINHGDWEGRLAADVERDYSSLLGQWRSAPHLVKMPGPGGETIADLQARALAALERTAFKFDGDVMLATHDAVIRVLLCSFVGAPLSSFWRFQIPNCSVSFVEFKDGFPKLGLLGDTNHLQKSFDRFEQKSL